MKMNWMARLFIDKHALRIAWLEKILSRFRPLAFLYANSFFGVVRQEVRLGSIGNEDMVMNIGCGAVPFTAIYVARLTGAKVIAMDKDEEAVEHAQKYIKAAGLDHMIRVVWGDGTCAAGKENATVWIVSLQATPKNSILNHFFESAPLGARIMLREPRQEFADRYDQISSAVKPKSITRHAMVTFNKTVLFTQE